MKGTVVIIRCHESHLSKTHLPSLVYACFSAVLILAGVLVQHTSFTKQAAIPAAARQGCWGILMRVRHARNVQKNAEMRRDLRDPRDDSARDRVHDSSFISISLSRYSVDYIRDTLVARLRMVNGFVSCCLRLGLLLQI